ncbi:MAG TPA: polysaccharide biosynthesis C-terminal domain-containing protein [Candidatus Acidoferrum sp.]|nr:polysaccharide biosynthesis C-terminal domain-containing protein [Candidatus Acidoferrum sp.]
MNVQPTAALLAGRWRERVTFNSISGIVRFAVVTLAYVVAYPLLLHSFGPALFGLWALLGSATNYAVLGDFGFANSLTILSASPARSGAPAEIQRLSNSASAIMLAAGGAMAILAYGLRGIIPELLRVPAQLQPDAVLLLTGLAGSLWIILLSNVYTALLSGAQRMDLTNVVQACGAVVNAFGIVLVVEEGWGVAGLVLSGLCSAVVMWASGVWLVHRVLGIPVRVVPLIHWATAVELSKMGVQLYIAALAALLMEPSVKFLLARYGSLAMVSHFEIGARVVMQGRSVFQQVLLPILPAAALVVGDAPQVRMLFSRAVRFLWLVAVPGFVILGVNAGDIIHIWMRQPIPEAEFALRWLAFGWLLNTLTIPAYLIAQGTGRVRQAMVCALTQGVIATGCTLLFVRKFGLSAAIVSLCIGLCIAAAYILFCYLRAFPTPASQFLGDRPVLQLFAPILLAGGLAAMRYWFPSGLLLPLLANSMILVAGYFFFLYQVSTRGGGPRRFAEWYLPSQLVRAVFAEVKK